MNAITARYGESVPLSITIDDTTAISATIYIGLEQEVPLITKTSAFVDGVADLSLNTDDTKIPLGTYKYQVNVVYEDDLLEKYPSPDSCEGSDFPDFVVAEALDETEVS